MQVKFVLFSTGLSLPLIFSYIYLVAFLFILVIVTYINEHVLLLLGMLYHFL